MGDERGLSELEAERLRAFNALAAQVDALQEMVKILSQRVDLLSERLALHVVKIGELDRRTVGSIR